MDNGGMRAGEALEGGGDEIGAGLRQHLHQHIARHPPAIGQRADEIKLGGPGGGKADLDLLQPQLDQQIEEAVLLLRPHRVEQGLIAIAQIGGEPARGMGDGAGGPLPVGQRNLGEGAVFDRRIGEHGHGLGLDRMERAKCAAGWTSAIS